MKFLTTLFIFACAVAMCTVASAWSHRKSIEEHLGEQCRQLLEQEGFSDISVEFNYLSALLTGYVDTEEDRSRAIALLNDKIQRAYIPTVERSGIQIRPVNAPWVNISREKESLTVLLKGTLSSKEAEERRHLGLSLFMLEGVDAIENQIELDAKTMNLSHAREFASLANELFSHSEFAELRLGENGIAISGEVENEAIRSNLLNQTATLPGKVDSENLIIKNSSAKIFRSEFRVIRSRFGVSVTGLVSDFEVKDKLVALIAQQSDKKVGVRMKIDSNAGEAFWLENAVKILPILFNEALGKIELSYSPDQIAVRGLVESEEIRNQIQKHLSKFADSHKSVNLVFNLILPQEISLNPDIVQPQIAVEIGEKRIVFSGQLKSSELKGLIRKSAVDRETDLEATVTDSIKLRTELPSEELLKDSHRLLTEAFRRIRTGRIVVHEGEVILIGETQQEGDKRLLQTFAENTFRKGHGIVNLLKLTDLSPLEGKSSRRKQLAESLDSLHLYFDSGSYKLKDSGSEKTTQIVDAINSSKVEASFVVTGITDGVGNPERNRKLSIKRAEAVREQLVEMGIKEDLLRVESFGEDSLEASDDEKQKSRRVEVRLDSVE